MASDVVDDLTAAIDAAERVTQIDGIFARLFAARITEKQWRDLSARASEKRRELLAVEAEKYRARGCDYPNGECLICFHEGCGDCPDCSPGVPS